MRVADFALVGGQRQQSRRGVEDRQFLAADFRQHGRRVAGPLVGCFPNFLARCRIERDYASPLAADVHQHVAAREHGRRADAEERLLDLVIGVDVTLPEPLTVLQRPAGELTVRAERDDALARDERRRAWAIAPAVVVAIRGSIRSLPLPLARGRVKALDALLVAVAIVQDESIAGDDGAAVALADILLPDNLWPVLRPGASQPSVRRSAVARRAEELRPVGGGGPSGHADCDPECNQPRARHGSASVDDKGGVYPARFPP